MSGGPAVAKERELRLGWWHELESGHRTVAPGRLRQLRLYGGAQGVWVDKARTKHLTPDGAGVAVAVLHNGRSYADDLTDDGVLYHFPRTGRGARRDAGEIEALRWAHRYDLPVFTITSAPRGLRAVRLSWVEGWEDRAGVFLLTFGDEPAGVPAVPDLDEPFELTGADDRRSAITKVRTGQQRFRFGLLRMYGPQCAICDLGVPELLEAAHIRPKAEHGTDDPRNGLLLCPTHHRALDAGLWAVEPDTLELVVRDAGPGRSELGIRRANLSHLPTKPHPRALAWAWGIWQCRR